MSLTMTDVHATYRLNDEKQGIEIRFAEKPSDEIRASLKQWGFRWSRFASCWYAKQSKPYAVERAMSIASPE
jgi:hypothetical protein